MDFDLQSYRSEAGLKRDYFFFADGYEKDMDFYAAEGKHRCALPFTG